MGTIARIANSLSARRILGFACNQGFVFFLFYMGPNRAFPFGSFNVERAELIGTLLFMVAAFGLLRLLSNRARSIFLARPLLILYAVTLVMGSLLPLLQTRFSLWMLIVECLILGMPAAFLLVAWGRSFGEAPTKASIPEVFLGSAIGALVCVLTSLVPVPDAALALRVLPFVSALALMRAAPSSESPGASLLADESGPETALLSAKIIAGTALFGAAAGLMETFSTDPGMAAMPSYPIALILFAAFAVGTLSLLFSDGFGKGAALGKAYRLALFIMLTGFLLIPVPLFSDSMVTGEAVVLTGYLGLTAVLISLFLVLASITGTDTAASFSRGFAALFGGELVGLIIANLIDAGQPNQVTPYFVVVIAGLLALLSYFFLFTERDFDSLSEIVTSTDTFEDRCKALAARFALSDRETEILPFILKGRTSERIAQELYITKSTVDTHLRRIYAKAGVHSRQELIDLSEGLGS